MSANAPAAGEAPAERPATAPDGSSRTTAYGTAGAVAAQPRRGSRDEPHTERWSNRAGSREEPSGERRGSRPSSRDDPHGERTAADDANNLSFRKFSRSVRMANTFINTITHGGGAHPEGGESAAVAAAAAAAAPAEAPEPPQGKRTWYDISCDRDGVKELVADNTYLLLFLVASSLLAFCAIHQAWGPTAIFGLCFVALVPLAVLLGDLTEALSGWCGSVLGGLLNATLGNATEAIVLVQAVRHRLVGVEQAALLGGVLSNTLLVLGLSFIAGGLATGGSQYFDRRVAAADVGVLLVSVIAVVLPTIAAAAPGGTLRDSLGDTRVTAVLLLAMYAAFLVYTLAPAKAAPAADDVEATPLLPKVKSGTELSVAGGDADEEDEELPHMSFWCIMFFLIGITVIMAIEAGALVTNVFPVSAALNITPDLVSCIFLPIIGNMAEMATAVIAARRGAIDLSLAVALGSSTQISLFLLPCAALLGWAIDVPFTSSVAGLMMRSTTSLVVSDAPSSRPSGATQRSLKSDRKASDTAHAATRSTAGP